MLPRLFLHRNTAVYRLQYSTFLNFSFLLMVQTCSKAIFIWKSKFCLGFHIDWTVVCDHVMQVESSDLISYGLIPEFIGRFPVLVSLSALNEDQLVQVIAVFRMLTSFITPPGSKMRYSVRPVRQYAIWIYLSSMVWIMQRYYSVWNRFTIDRHWQSYCSVAGSHRTTKRSWQTVQEDVRHEWCKHSGHQYSSVFVSIRNLTSSNCRN